jgi:hypothetical protein
VVSYFVFPMENPPFGASIVYSFFFGSLKQIQNQGLGLRFVRECNRHYHSNIGLLTV